MEDVLDLYEEEYDPQYPTVCLDEKPVVLHADVQLPVPVEPGQPERVEYEYERRGTRNLFVMVEPLASWRHVEVTKQRTMQDYAQVVRWLVDEVYPQAEYIRLVQDNLNTHTPASPYETFPLLKHAAFCSAWNSIPRPSTPVGSLWPRSRSGSSSVPAYNVDWQMSSKFASR